MKKLLSLLLALIMLAMPLLSCADNSGQGASSSALPSGSGSDENPDESPYLDLGLPVIDYKGREFRFYSRGKLADSELDSSAVDIYSEGLNTEVLNNAVFERNSILEELYGIKIVNFQFDEPYKNARIMISSDLYEAEVVTDAIGDLATLAVNRQLYEYNSFIKYTDFSKSWWDQNCYEQTSILGKVFYMCGDITIMDNKATWAVCFNKDLISENNLKSPYDSVNDKTWTYDQMYYLMEEAVDDVDGNGVMDESDIWGLVTQNYNQYALLVGSGATVCTKNEEDIPEFTFYNDRNLNALEKAITVNRAKNISYTKFGGGIEQKKLYYNGGALFLICSMSIIQWMRPYDTDFGVLPLPKLNEEQDQYYSCIQPSHYCVYSIPASVPEESLEFVDLILENLAAYSQKLVEPAFYEKVLVGQGLRDQESEPMLDIIFSNVVYDLGVIYEFGNFSTLLQTMSAAKLGSFASGEARYEGSVNKAISNLVTFVKTNFK